MTALDLALVNASVRTLDDAQPTASAVGLADGRIAVVGDAADVRDAGETIDLGGATVVPGIVDSHLHPFMGALQARGADLMDARTLDDVRRLVDAERRRCAPHEWVLGFGLDYNAFADTGIDGRLVEEAAGGAPTVLTFVDFHTGLATPRALELAGVDGPREFVEHAEVVVAGDGSPTGELRERAAIELVLDAMPELTAADRYRLCAEQLKRFAAVGMTGAHGMDGDLTTLDLLRELEANGDLAVRLRMPYWINPDTPEEVWEAYAAHRDERGRRWSTGVAKFFIDGVIDSGTAWLVDPDSEGMGLDSFWPDVDRYRRAVRFFAERGFQCVTHACGDRGVREALDTYRAAGAAPGVRHRIEHIETLQVSDYGRFAAEGVVASMQAQHMMLLAPDRSDNWSRRLGGGERCDRAFPIRDLWESGAVVTLGSDWPVARFDPREGLAAAQLRREPRDTGRAPYDDQALTGAQALEGYTTRPALVAGVDGHRGRITTGFDADLTVFAQDPARCPPDELVDTPIVLTVVDGEVVHRV